MNDPLKKYIRAHREDFDSEAPDPALWDRISQRIAMNPTASVRSFQWGLTAAVVVLAAVCVTLFFHSRSDRNAATATATALQDTTNDEALYDQEFYHISRIINIKFKEIEKIKNSQPELYQRFSADIQKLDASYQQLKQQLPTQTNQELLLQAMLQNLTLQVDLINRQLGIIEQLKNESHAKSTTHI